MKTPAYSSSSKSAKSTSRRRKIVESPKNQRKIDSFFQRIQKFVKCSGCEETYMEGERTKHRQRCKLASVDSDHVISTPKTSQSPPLITKNEGKPRKNEGKFIVNSQTDILGCNQDVEDTPITSKGRRSNVRNRVTFDPDPGSDDEIEYLGTFPKARGRSEAANETLTLDSTKVEDCEGAAEAKEEGNPEKEWGDPENDGSDPEDDKGDPENNDAIHLTLDLDNSFVTPKKQYPKIVRVFSIRPEEMLLKSENSVTSASESVECHVIQEAARQTDPNLARAVTTPINPEILANRGQENGANLHIKCSQVSSSLPKVSKNLSDYLETFNHPVNILSTSNQNWDENASSRDQQYENNENVEISSQNLNHVTVENRRSLLVKSEEKADNNGLAAENFFNHVTIENRSGLVGKNEEKIDNRLAAADDDDVNCFANLFDTPRSIKPNLLTTSVQGGRNQEDIIVDAVQNPNHVATNEDRSISNEDYDIFESIIDDNVFDGMIEDIHDKENDMSQREEDIVQREKNDIPTNNAENPGYQRRIFEKIFKRILSDEFFENLFNESDYRVITNYENLSDQAKSIFIRLFLRQYNWISKNDARKFLPKLSFFRNNDFFAELERFGFIENIISCQNIEELLNLMNLKDLKAFLNENGLNQQNCRKNLLIEKFLDDLTHQDSILGDRHETTLNSLHQKLKAYYRLNSDIRRLFLSIFHLYSLNFMSAKNLRSGNSTNPNRPLASDLIFQLLQKENKELCIQSVTGVRKLQIFENRHQLINYVEANELEIRLICLYQSKSYQMCSQICTGIRNRLINNLLLDEKYVDHISQLPTPLAKFSTIYVYATCLYNYGVESLQKLKKYQEAVDLLQFLLGINSNNNNSGSEGDLAIEDDDLFDPESNNNSKTVLKHVLGWKRGRFYERLVINFTVGLKNHEKAFEAIERAFNDPLVKEPIQHMLLHKAQNLSGYLARRSNKTKKPNKNSSSKPGPSRNENSNTNKRRSRKRKHTENDDTHSNEGWTKRVRYLSSQLRPLTKFKTKTIHCPILAKNLGGKRKHIFVSGDFLDVPVEKMAMDDYKTTENFTEALHDEGASWRSLFALLLFDEIYDFTLEDVWQSSQQVEPLDLADCNAFFGHDREKLRKSIMNLNDFSVENICEKIEKIWSEYFGTRSIVDWNCFRDLEQAKSLASCIGGRILSAVFWHLASDFKIRRSGFPDLILWNDTTKRFKVVEVKGPGDRLSINQEFWLSFFTKICIDAELCKVVANKKRGLT